MREKLIYVYCVSHKEPNFKDSDLGNSHTKIFGVRVYPICHQDLYAVVSKVSEDEFTEENLKKNLSDMKWVESNVLRHEEVIEEIMRDCTVIPFKFATIFKTEENVKALLEEHTEEFKKSLEGLEGKEEWGIKVYCNIDILKTNLIKENEEIKRMEQDIKLSSAGKAYLLMKKRDGLIESILNKKINEYGQDIFEELNALSRDTRINKLLPKEVTEQKDEMILNAAFLIDTCKIIVFIDTAIFLKEKYKDKGLNLNCTGPWPPYNFCSINPISSGRDSNLFETPKGVKKEKAI
ncbi:MAG: GvpL/GvpF family gas vesicle protein [Nitrospirae bacterium]|nr:GvpL/GvpF family gas vesicle protein [Nitrospirota bacterium]